MTNENRFIITKFLAHTFYITHQNSQQDMIKSFRVRPPLTCNRNMFINIPCLGFLSFPVSSFFFHNIQAFWNQLLHKLVKHEPFSQARLQDKCNLRYLDFFISKNITTEFLVSAPICEKFENFHSQPYNKKKLENFSAIFLEPFRGQNSQDKLLP